MNLGNRIKEVLDQKGIAVVDFADMIPCSRENAYKILKRPSIDTWLLRRISIVLMHDFFMDISENEIFCGMGRDCSDDTEAPTPDS